MRVHALSGILRSTHLKALSLSPYRSLYTRGLCHPLALHSLPRSSPRSVVLVQYHHFSLSSLFSSKPTSVISPYAVAEVSRKEELANAAPHDLFKQLAVLQAYAELDRKECWELILARWERMCEFDPSSPLLNSDKAFEMYLYALVKCNLESSVGPATRRRDSLLAMHHTSPQPVEPLPPIPGPSDHVVPPLTQSSSTTPSRSKDIADSILSGKSPEPLTTLGFTTSSSNSSEMAPSLAATLAGGSGTDRPIHVIVNEPKGAWKGKVARSVGVTLLSVVVFVTVFAYFLDNTGIVKAAPHQSEFEPSGDQKPIKFADVHGVDEAKDELADIVQFLKDPASFNSLGGKLPRGVLLTGPPGTGKTMLARAVAGEAGVPFLFASGSDFDEMFVGVGAKRVRELFEAARKKKPAIIFVDELDAVGGKRNTADRSYMRQTLNQLLVEMDGFQQAEGVIVIAATNVPDSLDPALVRPGRFDRHVTVPLPDIRGRTQIIQQYLKDVIYSPEVDPLRIARGTSGFSGADLQNMVNIAAIQATKEKAKEVTTKHMDWARDRILMGAERRSMVISPEDKLATAYHEGGHALVALFTDGATPLHKVTCMPRGHTLGHTSMLPKDDRHSVKRKEYRAMIDVSMGGRVAEEMIYGEDEVSSGAESDLKNATGVATHMIKSWGYSDRIGRVYLSNRDDMSVAQRDTVDSEIRRMLEESEQRVRKLLKSKEIELHRLADALVEHETLTEEEVHRVIRGEKLPKLTEVIKEDLDRRPRKSDTLSPTPSPHSSPSPAPGIAAAAGSTSP